ncbi:type 2 periplasmic-binding domain-containing protein [Salinibius halmophilus]|uniref:hypothetical protein n=1 Tax=Salinibius halmophilus TaxID=1853216 RepID=UPI000E6670DA|nr:hypothetical protein [Salinibius halmophilus]
MLRYAKLKFTLLLASCVSLFACHPSQVSESQPSALYNVQLVGSAAAYELAVQSLLNLSTIEGNMSATGSTSGQKLLCADSTIDGSFYLGQPDETCAGVEMKKIGYLGISILNQTAPVDNLSVDQTRLLLTQSYWRDVNSVLPNTPINLAAHNPDLATYVVDLLLDTSATIATQGETVLASVPNENAIAIEGIRPSANMLDAYPLAQPLYYLYRPNAANQALMEHWQNNQGAFSEAFIWLISD